MVSFLAEALSADKVRPTEPLISKHLLVAASMGFSAVAVLIIVLIAIGPSVS